MQRNLELAKCRESIAIKEKKKKTKTKAEKKTKQNKTREYIEIDQKHANIKQRSHASFSYL